MNRTTTPNKAVSTTQEQIQLLVSGFRSFSDVNAARKAISGIPGVSHVQARPMGAGVMVLLVSYAGMVPFQVHLAELTRGRGRALPAHVEVTA